MRLSYDNPSQPKVVQIFGRIAEKPDWSLEGLSGAERYVWVIHCAVEQINNGGVHQCFCNATGDLIADVLEGLEKIGAVQTYSIFQRAVSLFQDGPDPDQEVRRGQMDAMLIDDNAPFEALTDEFYERPEDLYGLLLRYYNEYRDSRR
jgi:hypothetical protein